MTGPSPAKTMEGFCTSLQLHVRMRRQVIRPVDRVCVKHGKIEGLGDHIDGLMHTSGLDIAEAHAPHTIGENGILEDDFEAGALDFLVDQWVAFLDCGNCGVGMGDSNLPGLYNHLDHL